MPLTTPSQLLAAHMLETIEQLQGNKQVEAMRLNHIVSDILVADNETLAAFANALGPVELANLCQAHLDQGSACNAGIAQLNAIATAAGMPAVSASVDIRPLSEKLAAQGRALEFIGGAFVVTVLPIQPSNSEEPTE